MRFTKIVSLTLVTVMVSALTACGSSGETKETAITSSQPAAEKESGETIQKNADTLTLKLANNQPESNATSKAVEWFAKEVNKRTDGRIFIEVHHNGELGDAVSCLEQAQYGGMDIIKADLSTMTNFVGEYNALMMP